MNLDTLEKDIVLTNHEAPVEVFGNLLSQLAFLTGKVREMRAAVEAVMVEKINASGEDIVIGDVRWYVGTEKKVKCRDAVGTVEAVLNATGGDMAKFAECLSANAFKYGTVRGLFDDVGDFASYDKLFETIEVDDLKTGKPKKKLLSVNEAFAK